MFQNNEYVASKCVLLNDLQNFQTKIGHRFPFERFYGKSYQRCLFPTSALCRDGFVATRFRFGLLFALFFRFILNFFVFDHGTVLFARRFGVTLYICGIKTWKMRYTLIWKQLYDCILPASSTSKKISSWLRCFVDCSNLLNSSQKISQNEVAPSDTGNMV